MTARSVSMGAPFRWFMKSLDVGRRNPKALFGGFALLLLIGLIPSVLQAGVQYGLKPGPAGMAIYYLIIMILSLVLMPPITGAAFLLLQATEQGRPASAGDIFHGYRDTAFGVRLVLTSLLLVGAYLVFFGLLFALLPGKEFFMEFMVRAATTPPGGQPDLAGLPPVPPSFALWLLGALFVLIVLTNAYTLAIAQAALGGGSPVAALVDGFAATLKNLLPLIGFAIVASIVGFIVILVVAVVVGLLAAVLGAVSPVLAVAVLVPVYLAAMLVIYVVMFGFYYQAWNDIFGAPVAPPADAIVA